MTPDERRFDTTYKVGMQLASVRAHDPHMARALAMALIEAGFAELRVCESDNFAKVFIGHLTFDRDPHGQTDFVAWSG